MQLYAWLNNNCQKFKIERLGDGSHILTPASGARIVSVAGSSTTAGTRLSLQDYSDCNCQKWLIATTTAREAVNDPPPLLTEQRQQGIYPNPVYKGKLLNINIGAPGKYISTNIFSSDGKLVYANRQLSSNIIQVPAPQMAGVYMLRVRSDEKVITQKLVVE
jgi:arabinan endo-1,5-alpha-L-arabinosidase